MIVEHDGDFNVFKIYDSYFRYSIDIDSLVSIEPKTKEVIYF